MEAYFARFNSGLTALTSIKLLSQIRLKEDRKNKKKFTDAEKSVDCSVSRRSNNDCKKFGFGKHNLKPCISKFFS